MNIIKRLIANKHKELKKQFDKTRTAKDNLDDYARTHNGRYHCECACVDCETVRDWKYDTPLWKQNLAEWLWGKV